jgi:hypothetical protein
MNSAEVGELLGDWTVNRANPKARFALLLYRLVRSCWTGGRLTQIAGLPAFIVYRVFVDWFWGIELSWRVRAAAPYISWYRIGGESAHADWRGLHLAPLHDDWNKAYRRRCA